MQLLLLALACGGTAVVLGLLLSPLLMGLLRRLHLGCTLAADGTDAPAAWTCPDGIGYLLPGLMFVAALGVALFTVGVVVMLRRRAHGNRSELSWAVARDLGWTGAAPLVAQAPVSVVAALSSTYSPRALWLGLVVGTTGTLPFLFGRARRRSYAAACLAAAIAAGLVVPSAFLLAPVIVGCAGLLLAAAVVAAATAGLGGQRTSATLSTD